MKNPKNQARGLARVSHLFLSGPEPQKEKVTIRGAAKALGVSKGTIITYLNKGLLKRIKQGGNIYILKDEVKALGSPDRRLHVSASVHGSGESDRMASVPDDKGGSKKPLAGFGLVETDRQYLPECKTALESKDKELETLKFQVNNLKRKLEIQAGKLERTEKVLRKSARKLHKRLLDVNNTANANDQDLLQKTEARLLAVEEELKRLRRSQWRELFDHLRLGPERLRKIGVVLAGALSLWAILVFSLWWLPRFQKQSPSPMNARQASRPGTFHATSQVLPDSGLQQEQTSGSEQQASESPQTTVAPEWKPAALNVLAPRPFSSSVEGSPFFQKAMSPLPEAEQQVVGLPSTLSPYVLRAETLATTWLRLVIDESQELEYLLHPNEKHTWRAISGFKLHIGNAIGLQLYLNDQPIKSLGESGEVVHLQLPDPSLIITSNSEYSEPVSWPWP